MISKQLSKTNRLKTTSEQVESLLCHQLRNLFPSAIGAPNEISSEIYQTAFKRTTNCISSVRGWGEAGFSMYVSWQYSTYLYFLSRELFLSFGESEIAEKIFLLNKALNSIELYYKVDLPDFFFLSHTLGLVFGQATYSNYSVFHQGCTVGRNGNERPVLEAGVVLFPNSSIIGKCLVRENTVISPGVQLVNMDTPGNCYVFLGEKGRPVFKEINEYFVDRFFDRSVE